MAPASRMVRNITLCLLNPSKQHNNIGYVLLYICSYDLCRLIFMSQIYKEWKRNSLNEKYPAINSSINSLRKRVSNYSILNADYHPLFLPHTHTPCPSSSAPLISHGFSIVITSQVLPLLHIVQTHSTKKVRNVPWFSFMAGRILRLPMKKLWSLYVRRTDFDA